MNKKEYVTFLNSLSTVDEIITEFDKLCEMSQRERRYLLASFGNKALNIIVQIINAPSSSDKITQLVTLLNKIESDEYRMGVSNLGVYYLKYHLSYLKHGDIPNISFYQMNGLNAQYRDVVLCDSSLIHQISSSSNETIEKHIQSLVAKKVAVLLHTELYLQYIEFYIQYSGISYFPRLTEDEIVPTSESLFNIQLSNENQLDCPSGVISCISVPFENNFNLIGFLPVAPGTYTVQSLEIMDEEDHRADLFEIAITKAIEQ